MRQPPSLRRSLLLNGMIPLLLILLLGFLLFGQVLRVKDEAALVAHTNVVQRQANHVLSLMAGAESDLRGFLITGEDAFRQSHARLNFRIGQELAGLERLVGDSPTQVRAIRAIEQSWPRWERNASQEIQAHQRGNLEVRHYVLGPNGAPLMQELQQRLRAFLDQEGVHLAERQAALWRTSRISGLIGGGGLLLAMAFFALFSFRQFRLLNRFYRGNIQALEAQKTELMSLTASLEEAKATLEARVAERTRALEAANQALGRLAALDGLTGIPNRRSFDEALRRECRRAQRDGIPLSCVMIDIDHFKAYNDTYGHQAGDDCLSRVAQTLEACQHRPGDLVARYGGEEFGVILPDTDAAGARVIAERMRQEIEKLGIPHARSSAAPHVTLSLGVATLDFGDMAPEELLQTADRFLYQAKHLGRNQVACALSTAVPGAQASTIVSRADA